MSKTARANYRDLRARLIKRGWTLRSWAISRGYPPPTVYDAARLTRRGIITTRIRTELESTAYAN